MIATQLISMFKISFLVARITSSIEIDNHTSIVTNSNSGNI